MPQNVFCAKIVFVCLATLSLLLGGHEVCAQNSDVYTVANVPIDIASGSATVAQDVAIKEGKSTAFNILMARLIPIEFTAQYPKVSQATLESLVLGVEVFNEKRSNVRYMADLKVVFDPEGVRTLILKSALPFSETKSKPILVLPILHYDYQTSFLEQSNILRTSWLGREKYGDLVPVVILKGDQEDQQIINTFSALEGDESRIHLLRQRYDARSVLVSEVKYSESRLNSLSLNIDYYSDAGKRSQVKDLERPPSIDDIEQFLNYAVATVHQEVTEEWKQKTLIQRGQLSRAVVRVPITSFQEWLTIRKRLKKVSVLEKILVTSLTTHQGYFDLYFYGQPQQFIIALAQENIDLKRTGGLWTLVLRG